MNFYKTREREHASKQAYENEPSYRARTVIPRRRIIYSFNKLPETMLMKFLRAGFMASSPRAHCVRPTLLLRTTIINFLLNLPKRALPLQGPGVHTRDVCKHVRIWSRCCELSVKPLSNATTCLDYRQNRIPAPRRDILIS